MVRPNKVIIKPADKGSIVVVITPKHCWTMFQSHYLMKNIIESYNAIDPTLHRSK